jgi:hypothetical protein
LFVFRSCVRQLEDILQALAHSKADDMRGLCARVAGTDTAAAAADTAAAAAADTAAAAAADTAVPDSTAATPAPQPASDIVGGIDVPLPAQTQRSLPSSVAVVTFDAAVLSLTPYDMYVSSLPCSTYLLQLSYQVTRPTCCQCVLTFLVASFAPSAQRSMTFWREILK